MSSEPSRAVELRLRAAIESAPSGIIMIDTSGTIVLVNREVERLFGYSREELLGRSIDLLLPDRIRAVHAFHRVEFLKSPVVRSMGAGRDLHGRRKDGVEVPVEVGLTPVVTDEGVFVVSAVVDITRRKAAEEDRARLQEQLRQSQKMEAVGALAGGIAHDFNNILAAIMGYAELAQSGVPDRPEVLSDLAGLLASAQQGKRLVERILSFSRRQAPQRRALSLGETATEVTKLLRASLPPSIAIRTSLDPNAPRVLADPTSVHQVLMNLATNAAHAIRGEGELEILVEPFYARDSFVRTHPDLHEGPYALLAVKDTGSGMDTAVLERVFEPFFTTKPPGAGTGLGLSMVHRIMLDHQGAIDLESEPGHGTTARCYFPAIAAEAPETSIPAPSAPRGKGQSILYVDDDEALAQIGKRRLSALGYAVTPVSDSVAALELVRSRPGDFDLVITDYWMPKITGLDLATEIHKLAPEAIILMLTGYGDELAEEVTAAAGIVRVVRKPVTARQLGEAVAEVLAAQPALAERA